MNAQEKVISDMLLKEITVLREVNPRAVAISNYHSFLHATNTRASLRSIKPESDHAVQERPALPDLSKESKESNYINNFLSASASMGHLATNLLINFHENNLTSPGDIIPVVDKIIDQLRQLSLHYAEQYTDDTLTLKR